MKNLLLLIFISLSINTITAQKAEFKKGKVFVDNKECLEYKKSDANNIEISTLDGTQTIYLKYIRTGIGHNGGLYTKIIFVEQDKSFTSRSYIFTKKILVQKLLADEVVKECMIDEEQINKFLMKYDEKIEESLIRY